MTRLPKHNDIVLMTLQFPDQELSIVRTLVREGEDAIVVWPQDVVYAIAAEHLKLVDYGVSWVFEDDVEGAAAFKVSVALL